MRDFFISYTKADESWAVWIAWILEEIGFSVIIQAWDIFEGDNFMAEMQRAMTGTRKTIAVLSEDYLESEFGEEEWTAAKKRKALVPIRIKSFEPGGFFATMVYLDIVGRTEQDARIAILGGFNGDIKAESIKSDPPRPGRRKPPQAPPYPREAATATAGVNVTDKIIDSSAVSEHLRSHLACADKFPFSSAERVKLYRNLEVLKLSQFNILVFALDPPADVVPPMPAAQDERINALLRWAEGRNGRGLGEVQNVFEAMLRPAETPFDVQSDAHRGVDVIKTCDRTKQEQEFKTLFNLCNEKRAGYAQIYIVHGREREGHTSLVERFRDTAIQEQAGGSTKVGLWKLEWPQIGNLKVDSQRLVSLLFENRGCKEVSGEVHERADVFRKLAVGLETPVVVVLHKIEAEDWMRTTRRLIRSYVKFWDKVKDMDSDRSLPLFIIFLNVFYPGFNGQSQEQLHERRSFWHRLKIARIKLGLWRVSRMRGRSPVKSPARRTTSVAVLKELPCVTLTDVKDWMSKHHYGELEVEWEAYSQGIFWDKKWALFECKNMADIEGALVDFVTRMTPTRRAYT